MTQVLESLDWHDIWEKKKKKSITGCYFSLSLQWLESFLKIKLLLSILRACLTSRFFYFWIKCLKHCVNSLQYNLPPKENHPETWEIHMVAEDERCSIKRCLQKTSLEVGQSPDPLHGGYCLAQSPMVIVKK